MRHRRFFGRRRSKPPVQWVASASGYLGTAVTVTANNVPASYELCGASGVALDADPPLIQRFTIERIVGEAHVVQTAAGTIGAYVLIGVGIIVCQSSLAGGVIIPNPNIQQDAGQPWIWLRHFAIDESGSAQFPIAAQEQLPNGIAVDTRRNRRIIKEGQQLRLVFAVFNASTTSTGIYSVAPFIRTLIKRVA